MFYITTLYRSPSQPIEEFISFKMLFEQTLDNVSNKNPYISFFLGDFNARNSNWWSEDIDNSQGLDIDELSSYYILTQLIKDPTHILPYSKSCIDLIFTSQPNLVTDSGVHSSLSPACHHQIVFTKFDLDIFYPPPYERLVWDYSKGNNDLIKRSVCGVNWKKVFNDCDQDDKVNILNELILNIIENFVPNKIVKCNDKDPIWMTKKIKQVCKEKAKAYKKFVRNGRSLNHYDSLQQLSVQTSNIVNEAKINYLSRMSMQLNDPTICPKKYLSIVNRFLNKKKAPIIPPVIEDGTFITDFTEKAELFNSYFANQCTPLHNQSELPSFSFKTESRLENIVFTEEGITSIITSLDSNKAHGCDNISIRMVKICGESLALPLKLIFEESQEIGIYPDLWKKSNVVPVHKKQSKNLIKNYRPISLLPIFSKIIYERYIYNSLYSYLQVNSILSSLPIWI